MKAAIKTVLPAPALRLARKLLHRTDLRQTPSVIRYGGTRPDVVDCCVAYNRYGGYCIPLSSIARPAAQRVLSGGVYEPDTIEYVAGHCGTGDIVHAGTFFGDFLPAYSRFCSPGAHVWAFEPNPESWRCASITIEINGLHNVSLEHAALGSHPGRLPLRVADDTGKALGGRSRLVDTAAGPGDGIVEVEIVTIDHSVPDDRDVSIIQLDVEGFEELALSGAIQTVRRCLPILILESISLAEKLSDDFAALGYHDVGRLHDNRVFVVD